ncbi:DNA sulfur modification protein DndB [Desertivirga brevis]|uniref:DNA sulfur modification protein DndB n=1 Tax=Desertivirga brevis TaxID=2810310 RepID=UPI001A97944F|nr:DNA sulfur modification protein DndB [Pedobacter sp. SYSU D00873]
MAGNKITGKSINQRKYIDLHGMYGVFDLPKKTVKVRYFSTLATGSDNKSDSYTLLKELKPMRERVKASEIKDLASLLQRNLDDYRVAYELIPYLIKNQSIAFFPAVLGVLMPKNLLSSNISSAYPQCKVSTASDGSENQIFNFDDKWKLELFNINNQQSRLGILSIDISDVDIIVLDGQHRANAFRVACGAFSDKDSTVYPAFYKDVVPSDALNADLPITLIWFEDDKFESDFDPKYISRRLFVDVNNSAKKVSKSRKILLNDYEIPSLLTRFFYSAVATSNSFALNTFSLFHSEFDKDSDLVESSSNVLAITNPEFVYEIQSWLTLGSRQYNQLHQYKSRDYFKNNSFEFSEIFNSPIFNSSHINYDDESLNSKVVSINDFKKIGDFENQYLQVLHPPLYSIFSKFTLFQQHYKACTEIGNWYDEEMNTTQRTVWEQVFCGGEGLYYTFKSKELKDKANKTLKNYVQAIDEIEKRFKQIRAEYFKGSKEKEVNLCFESATTKAFQVGLFMALDLYKDSNVFNDSYEDFISALNKISPEDWVTILTDIKPELIKGVDPKLWPSYQKLIIRVIQKNESPYYLNTNFLSSPDGRIFKDRVITYFNSWWNTRDDISEGDLTVDVISMTTISKWGRQAKDEVDNLFLKANIPIIKEVDTNNEALKVINEIIGKPSS